MPSPAAWSVSGVVLVVLDVAALEELLEELLVAVPVGATVAGAWVAGVSVVVGTVVGA
jgi:uncharacterized membrane protein YjfL (UPF0719 family)